MAGQRLSSVPGLSFEDDILAFAFTNLASRELEERQELSRHFERLLFPTPAQRRYMWQQQGNRLHAYVSERRFFRENLTLMMIQIRLNLVTDIMLYDTNYDFMAQGEYDQQCELLCCFIPSFVTPHSTIHRNIPARLYRRHMRLRLGR